MHYVYILESQKDLKYYIGCTNDLYGRIYRHNKGYVSSTKGRRPLKLIKFFEYKNKSDAFEGEKYLKSLKGNKAFKVILNGELPKRLKGRVC